VALKKAMRRFLCVGIIVSILHWVLQFVAWSYADSVSPEMGRARMAGAAAWTVLSVPLLSVAPGRFLDYYFEAALILNSLLWGTICAAVVHMFSNQN